MLDGAPHLALAETYERADLAPGVELGPNATIEAPVILGKAPRGRVPGELPLRIGADAIIRPFTTIYAGSILGDRLQTGQGASIREDNLVGDDVSIGTNAVLEFGNRIGNRVRIHTHCFLELVTVEDDVFIGPNVVFTDDSNPTRCPEDMDCLRGATVGRLARIGANSTILPGVKIGENALVGAGSVVVHDVPPGMVVAGNPARVIKAVVDLVSKPNFFSRPYVWELYVHSDRDENIDVLPVGVAYDRRIPDRRSGDQLSAQRSPHAHDRVPNERRVNRRRWSDDAGVGQARQSEQAHK
jgi:acetyltransferase-like isoleucine patch superfamily enzyme